MADMCNLSRLPRWVLIGLCALLTPAPALAADAADMRLSVLNVNYYQARYPEVAKAFGTNWQAVQKHWLDNGIREGRQPNPLVDLRSYVARYPDLRQAYGENWAAALDHWLKAGEKEGRSAAPTGTLIVPEPRTGSLYMINGAGYRREFASPEVLAGCGLDYKSAVMMNADAVQRLRLGSPIASAQACKDALAGKVMPADLVSPAPAVSGADAVAVRDCVAAIATLGAEIKTLLDNGMGQRKFEPDERAGIETRKSAIGRKMEQAQKDRVLTPGECRGIHDDLAALKQQVLTDLRRDPAICRKERQQGLTELLASLEGPDSRALDGQEAKWGIGFPANRNQLNEAAQKLRADIAKALPNGTSCLLLDTEVAQWKARVEEFRHFASEANLIKVAKSEAERCKQGLASDQQLVGKEIGEIESKFTAQTLDRRFPDLRARVKGLKDETNSMLQAASALPTGDGGFVNPGACQRIRKDIYARRGELARILSDLRSAGY